MKKNVSLSGVASGFAAIIITAMVLCGLLSLLLVSGLLPVKVMNFGVFLIMVLSCFIGGMITSGRAKNMPLPMSLLAAGLYLAVIFILRGIVFETVGDRVWLMLMIGFAGAILGSLSVVGRHGRS